LSGDDWFTGTLFVLAPSLSKIAVKHTAGFVLVGGSINRPFLLDLGGIRLTTPPPPPPAFPPVTRLLLVFPGAGCLWITPLGFLPLAILCLTPDDTGSSLLETTAAEHSLTSKVTTFLCVLLRDLVEDEDDILPDSDDDDDDVRFFIAFLASFVLSVSDLLLSATLLSFSLLSLSIFTVLVLEDVSKVETLLHACSC